LTFSSVQWSEFLVPYPELYVMWHCRIVVPRFMEPHTATLLEGDASVDVHSCPWGEVARWQGQRGDDASSVPWTVAATCCGNANSSGDGNNTGPGVCQSGLARARNHMHADACPCPKETNLGACAPWAPPRHQAGKQHQPDGAPPCRRRVGLTNQAAEWLAGRGHGWLTTRWPPEISTMEWRRGWCFRYVVYCSPSSANKNNKMDLFYFVHASMYCMPQTLCVRLFVLREINMCAKISCLVSPVFSEES